MYKSVMDISVRGGGRGVVAPPNFGEIFKNQLHSGKFLNDLFECLICLTALVLNDLFEFGQHSTILFKGFKLSLRIFINVTK